MHYSPNPGDCRVDFFKASGAWYSTERLRWDIRSGPLISEAFAMSLAHLLVEVTPAYGGRPRQVHCRLIDMVAVVIEPNYAVSHPVMMPVADALRFPAVLERWPELRGMPEALEGRRRKRRGLPEVDSTPPDNVTNIADAKKEEEP